MDELNRVFLPLRSNIGWFKSSDLREDISNRVKESILLYDEIYIEDGTFRADVVEGSRGPIKWYSPPGSIGPDERSIEYKRDLEQTDVTIGIGKDGDLAPRATILQGHTIDRFKIDYDEIFRDIEKDDYEFLKFDVYPEYAFPRKAKDILREQSWEDERNFEYIHPNSAIRDLVIKNLNHDLVLSILLKSSIVMDSRHQDLLKKKCWHPESTFSTKPVVEHVALNQILDIRVPKFSNLSIEKVLELRNDRSWCNFRDFLRDTVATVKDDPEILSDHQALENALRSQREKALFEELEQKYLTGPKLVMGLGLGAMSLIPGFGVIPTAVSGGKSLKSYWDDKSTWFAFLLKLKHASESSPPTESLSAPPVLHPRTPPVGRSPPPG